MDNILNSTVEMSQAELILQLAKTNVEQEKRLKTTELRSELSDSLKDSRSPRNKIEYFDYGSRIGTN